MVNLPDGTLCPEAPVQGLYCRDHLGVSDRDFQIFQVAHDHFEQDLREFWQRSNFYLVVDGLLVSALTTAHGKTLHIVLASAGLIVSAFWFLVARGSIRWLDLWRDEVRRLDRIVNRFQTFDHIESHVSTDGRVAL